MSLNALIVCPNHMPFPRSPCALYWCYLHSGDIPVQHAWKCKWFHHLVTSFIFSTVKCCHARYSGHPGRLCVLGKEFLLILIIPFLSKVFWLFLVFWLGSKSSWLLHASIVCLWTYGEITYTLFIRLIGATWHCFY